MMSPSMRGCTSVSTASTPVASSASTSSFSFIEPISAAKALPVRPATMIAREQHAQFTQHTDGDQVHHVDAGPILARLARRKIGNDHRDQEGDQRHDGDGRQAGVINMPHHRDGPQAPPSRACPREYHRRMAHEIQAVAHFLQPLQRRAPQTLHGVVQRVLAQRHRRAAGSACSALRTSSSTCGSPWRKDAGIDRPASSRVRSSSAQAPARSSRCTAAVSMCASCTPSRSSCRMALRIAVMEAARPLPLQRQGESFAFAPAFEQSHPLPVRCRRDISADE